MQKRFVDKGDGTVVDMEEGLMWKQTDGFQDESKWFHWFAAEEYITGLNNKKFAGRRDWRMPTLEEAETLFDESVSIRDCDRFEIFIDPSFSPGGGHSTWTTTLKPHNGAVIFYYRYGHPNINNRDDPSKDSIRAVRTLTPEEKEKLGLD
ncbi:MAG: DUF1566 domain-containing protein [Nitrospina sp.]|nr:DUF1566 domain-containing protein [Nitrospina sp.]